VTAAPLVEARHLARSYGRRPVLVDVNLELRAGEVVGVTGENGAGKTTLLQILVGRIGGDRGTVARRGSIGYCPQDPLVFPNLTVAENFRFFGAAHGLSDWRGRLEDLAPRLGFAGQEERRVAELSGGTRQKLNLALALVSDPQVLLLDEPYAGFDWETYLRFWDLAAELRARGRALLVVSHLLHETARVDRVLRLAGGRLE
jgi:ABC-2 type transport system ATP-binding protein